MKLSDYVADFIEKTGVKDIFLISGGGMMHLLDSVGKHENLRLVCNLNEQASSICADSYGQYTNNLGVCMLTTGPGGTNAVTGIAAAYMDSTPVLAISGQCKTADSAVLRNVRFFGAQEVDIVSIVKPITKYAVRITEPETIRFHLEKAIWLAQNGRRGPVWLDIPLDVQAAQIDPETLPAFDPQTKAQLSPAPDYNNAVSEIFQALATAKRPVFLVGHGVTASGRNEFRALAEQLRIPVLVTWRAKDIFPETHPLYFGSPGIPATRYSNFVLQNSDLLIVLGTRLNPVLTAYDEPHFAFQAKKYIVDIDMAEMDKLNINFERKIHADAGKFIQAMLHYAAASNWRTTRPEWLAFCQRQKDKYPLEREIQPLDNEGLTDGFYFAKKLSCYCQSSDVFVGSSSGRTCGISHMAFEVKEGQRFVSSMGLGSMGFVIPSAISCCLASGKRRTVALEGDGSLQHNIQELQLIQNYQLPIKLFILSNKGYASIYMMQKNNFEDRFAACHEPTHVAFPSLKDIAAAYRLDYYCIHHNEEIETVLQQIMADNRPVLCEVMSSIYFDEIPKSMTIAHGDGTFSSSKLENLYPFLSPEELAESMPEWNGTDHE